MYATVNRILSGYSQSWANMYREACEATNARGEQSADVLDLRMAGLDECLDGLRALSQAFRQANAEVIENAVSQLFDAAIRYPLGGPGSGEYRIEDLARLAGTTTRNIRVYRDRGLLPPPLRVAA